MSISKLRSRRGVLARQEHVKSPNGIGENTSAGAGASAGVIRASVVATVAAAENVEETHKTAIKQTASLATAKLLNAAAINAAVVAAATVATVTAKQQQQQQTQFPPVAAAQTNLPHTSLLKIEPFVPSLTTRLRRRPIGRSYTTLSPTSTTTTTTTTNSSSISKKQISKQSNNTNIAATLNSPLLGAAIDSQLAKANTVNTRAAVAARLRRNPVRTLVKRQRSKSTSSSASNRPATAHRMLSPNMPLNSEDASLAVAGVGGGPATDSSATSSTSGNCNGSSNSNAAAIVTLQPNGICRIKRCAEEREKQPDRINYDRRGLSAIPIFEQETQLRLLSLQHNLINIFHIPKEERPLHPPPTQQQSAGLAGVAAQAEVSRPSPDMQSELVAKCERSALVLTNGVGRKQQRLYGNGAGSSICVSAGTGTSVGVGVNVSAGVRLSLALGSTPARQLHCNTLAPPPPPPTPLGQMQTLLHAATPPPQIYQQLLQQRLSAVAKNNSGKKLYCNAPLLPLPRQPTPSRFALKRSKSFLTNIPRHLQSMQKNMLKTQMVHAGLAAATGADVGRLKSFDSNASALTINSTDSSLSTLATATTANTYDSNKTINSTGTTFVGSEYDEDDPLQLLAVKNRQLIASYGMIFQHLVFLDLYDNQIERIGNLDGLPALSVLLLGKNRISDISGLASLKQTLRVLDLHGNKITSIASKLNCLQELKSLNLAGNLLRQIGANDFSGLQQLRELNLKRNKIKRINGFQHLISLERLWLCHNELHRVDDMSSIAKATNLLEITIDNNPVSLAGDCVSFLVSYLPRLQSLTQMPITEQVRNAAMSWRRNKEISDTHYAHLTPDAYQSIKREEVISNARTNWELLRSQQMMNKQDTTKLQQKQTNSATPRIAKPSELSRINESNEMVVEVANGSGEQAVAEPEEHIKLPSIQRPEEEQKQRRHNDLQQTQTSISGRNEPQQIPKPKSVQQKLSAKSHAKETCPNTKTHYSQQPKNVSNNSKVDNNNNNNSARLSGSPGSSLGPNVHSSSSCFSSDNEESTELMLQQRGMRVRKFQKTVGQQQRRGVAGVEGKDDKNDVARSINGTTEKHCESRRTIAASEGSTGARVHKVKGGTEGTEQIEMKTANPLDTNEGTKLDANSVTTKQKINDTNPTSGDTTVQPTTEESSNVENTTTAKSSGEAITQVAENNSSILMPIRRHSSMTNATSKTMMPQQKEVVQTTNTISAPTTQITNQASSSSSTLTLGIPSMQLPPQQQQQTNNLSGNVLASSMSARTTCRRLMRSQTVVSVTNNCTTTAANSGNDGAGGGGGGSRRTTNNHNKTSASLACNGQASAHPPTVTCIVAPTPLNTPNNNSSNNSSISIMGGQQRTTVASKAEREAREREKEREREREQGGDYLIEICGRYLNVYGQGALRYIDKQWNAAKAHDVHTLNFSYINFNNIAATVLARIKTRFPNAENFVFRETNIEYIGQLNALAELQGIGSLTIDPEGNVITTKDLWREYAIYRLSHWGLKLINGVAVTEAAIEASNVMYEGLGDLVLWAMPGTMLQPLLARLRLDETCTASKMSPKEWLMKPENKSLRLVVGKEALQWKKPTNINAGHNTNNNNNNNNGNTNINALSMRERGRLHFATMLENTVNAVEKLRMLESLWPSMLLDIVRNALLDYSHLDEYLRNVIDEIMK